MAKRVKKCFNEAITYDKVYRAYLFARRGKKKRSDVIKYSMRVEENIMYICNKLKNNNFKFCKYKEFFVYEPKLRKILAAPFKDRIVHTWYVKEFIEKIFTPQFIHTSYACIKNRGVHICIKDIKNALYKVSVKWNNAYIIKMDVAKFFQSVNRNILLDIINRKVSDKIFLAFTKILLDTSKEYDVNLGVGIPIGNFSSQMFGNIYLNEVDYYAKHTLKCKYYFRYLDDTCIICESKDIAKNTLLELTRFYKEKLMLELNSKTEIFPIKNGINFCGYKISINDIKIKNRGKKKLILKLKKIRNSLKNGKISTCEAKKSICGHIGYIKCANVYGLVNKHFYMNKYI